MTKKSRKKSGKALVEAILADHSLVKAIVESSKNMGEPMSAEEFAHWMEYKVRK